MKERRGMFKYVRRPAAGARTRKATDDERVITAFDLETRARPM